ncbi:MAG: hypothetical protein V2A79_01280 [Planctomycetota bacterium]
MKNAVQNQLGIVAACAALGCTIGGVAYWVTSSESVAAWIVVGGVIGVAVGVLWPVLRSFALCHQIADWRLEEVEFHGLKFTSGGAQRRVAWRLFVEIATRIAAQPMRDEDGDDGVALKSLYDLFQLVRKAVSEMQPTPAATGETVETYALDMLNSDLRPFLAQWHPAWDAYAKGGNANSQAWPEHNEFRVGLRSIQVTIESRARGLAHIAGVTNVDRFFPRRSVEGKNL